MTFKRSNLGNQLVLHYQPVFDIHSFQAIGFEALCRLSKRDDGVLQFPSSFIPYLSHINLVALDLRVISKALSALQNSQLGFVFINLDGLLRLNSTRLFSLIDLLNHHCTNLGIPSSQVVFEISESVSFIGREHIYEAIAYIKSFGFMIAIDDYGKENSNIERLCKTPCDFLKIDKSIIDLLNHSDYRSKAGSIIKSITDVCSSHDIHVICEGVETSTQHSFLVDIGQTFAQGYFYSKPLPLSKSFAHDLIGFNQESA